jgi:hypothetical protein
MVDDPNPGYSCPMKTPLNWIIAAAIGLAVFFVKTSGTIAQSPVPVPVSITPSVTAYKVIDMNQISVSPGKTPAETLEAGLNSLGSQGWKVVTTTGTLIILRR